MVHATLRTMKAFGLISLLCLFSGCGPSGHEGAKAGSGGPGSLPPWEIKNPAPSDWPMDPVVAGPNTYVSYACGALRFSPDGKTWSVPRLPQLNRDSGCFGEVVYGQNQFLALFGKSILASPDGSDWSQVAECPNYPTALAYGEGRYAAVGQGCLMGSRDGKTWTSNLSDTSADFSSVAYGNGCFVATRSMPDEIWRSEDGLAWSQDQTVMKPPRGESESYVPISVVFGNGRFLIRGRRDYTSADGRKWALERLPLDQNAPVFFIKDRFIAFRPGSTLNSVLLFTSVDLTSWRTDSTDLSFLPAWLGFVRGQYVTRGENSYSPRTSLDLIHWPAPATVTSENLSDVAFGDGRFVATGYRGTLLTSGDGSAWTRINPVNTNALFAIAYGNGVFVAVGDSGTRLYSKDGQTWAQADSVISESFYRLCFSQGEFIALASDSKALLRSRDGKKWRLEGALPDGGYDLTCCDGKYFSIGSPSSISPDGIRWEKSLLGSSSGQSVICDGSRFLMSIWDESGFYQLASENGLAWRQSEYGYMSLIESLPREIKGELRLSGHGLYFFSEGRVYAIGLPMNKGQRACYGKGLIVGVGNEGSIAVLRPVNDPERQPAATMERNANPGAFRDRRYYGQMDHEFIFVLTVTSDGRSLSGSYSYLGKRQSLRIGGTVDSAGYFHLQEYSETGQSTGAFDGKFAGTELLGEWSSIDETRRLRFEAYAADSAQAEARLRRFQAAKSGWVGVYEATQVYEQTADGTRDSCSRSQGRWACESYDYTQNRLDPREPTFGLKAVEALRFEVQSDFTLKLSMGGDTRLVLPLAENRMVYDNHAYFITKGIRLKELDDFKGKREGREDAQRPFILKADPEGNAFNLVQHVSDTYDRTVKVKLEKVR